MKTARWLVLAGLIWCALVVSAGAQATPVEVRDQDTMQALLRRYTGKQVELVLSSGEHLVGKVGSVTQFLVHLRELRGKEFFDAVVVLSQTQAVIVRVRSR